MSGATPKKTRARPAGAPRSASKKAAAPGARRSSALRRSASSSSSLGGGDPPAAAAARPARAPKAARPLRRSVSSSSSLGVSAAAKPSRRTSVLGGGGAKKRRPDDKKKAAAVAKKKAAAAAAREEPEEEVDDEEKDDGRGTQDKVQVAVRVRPVASAAEAAGAGRTWLIEDAAVEDRVDGKRYAFDQVLGATARNADVYSRVARRIVDSALDGINGTLMAYGQTGSGKTHTVFGTEGEPGLVRLAFDQIFAEVDRRSAEHEFLLRVSYLEIYKERVRDLLGAADGGGGGADADDADADASNLAVRQRAGKAGRFFVEGLRESVVTCVQDVVRLVRQGNRARQVGVTDMNERSSRSHAVVRLVLESAARGADGRQVRVSVLNLVDLAGSETLSDSSDAGQRAETRHINASLTQLKTVVKSLCDGVDFVPYRNSVLTKILKDSLGGNARTAVVVTMSPAEDRRRMSRGSLQFGQMANRVSNRARVNEFLDNDARVKLRQYKRKVRELEEEKASIQADFAKLRREVDALKRREDERQELENWSAALDGKPAASSSGGGDGGGGGNEAELARQLQEMRGEMVARGIDRDASLADLIRAHERDMTRVRREHDEELNRAAAETFQLRDEARNLRSDLKKTHRSYQTELLHLRQLLNAVEKGRRAADGGAIDVEAEEQRSVAVVEAELLRKELASARAELDRLRARG